jgi:purine-cytosine permease-like protein
MNLYATGLDMESLIPRLSRTQTTLLTSAVAIALVFLGTFVLDAVDSITALTLVLNVLAGSWVAVILVGHLRCRRTYDPHDLQVLIRSHLPRTGGRYWYTRGWNLRAAAAWGAGSLVGLLTVSTTLFAGPFAGVAGGVDISLVSSTLVAGAVYALAHRS